MSYSLQRTNPRIASNIKIVLDDKYNLNIESINSNFLLERSVYKAFEYNEALEWGTNIKNFASQFIDKNLLYDVVDESVYNTTDKTELQYHQIYDYGAYSDSSKLIDANYRFFAPIHVEPNTTQPDAFVIMKVPAVDVTSSNNKISDYVENGEVVEVFDLAKLQPIFKSIEQSSIDMQFANGTITNGLSLESGVMTSKEESIIDAMLANESTITEFENGITNNYREHNLIYSNIVNVEFAFNDVVDGKFTRYVGFYVNFNEIDSTTIRDYIDTGTIKLYKHLNGYSKYNSSHVFGQYDVIKHSQFANGFGLTKAPQLRLQVVLRPAPGSKLVVKYNTIVEDEIIFDYINVGTNINTTAEFIAKKLNDNYTGQYSSFIAFVENGNEVVVRSSSINSLAENINFEVPTSINIEQPLFNINGNVPYTNMKGSDIRTISLNTYYNTNKFNKIQYFDANGVHRISEVALITKYAGDYLYHLVDEVTDKTSNPDTIWFVETLDEQPILCSVTEHKDFDFDTTESQYTDILDFDIVAYKKYLVDIINSNDFRGRADAFYAANHIMLPATNDELNEYKNTLLTYVDNYFDSIDLNRNYLFENIALNTHEATTTTNEYERLAENDLQALTTTNRLYKYIHKWSYIAGTDVYANDYRLNISLPFRYDSFTPSLESANRDIRYHTHSWLIICEGRSPYVDINDNNINKLLSYSRLPLTRELLLSKNVDAYEYLKYETSVRTYDASSKLVWNIEQEACYTYFRGVLLRFDDKTLDDYKFASVLFSSEPVEDDVLRMEFIRNDEFKTLTLVVNFYIPDPILTTVERDSSFYYLDRSLLYFSNEIYSTGQDAINFGTDKISLSLYNNTAPKQFLGQVVTNNWFHQTTDGTLLYVSRGDLTRFNTALDSIIKIGDTFTIFFTDTDDTSLPGYGMEITFVDIQEVHVEHFWCRKILIKHINTHDVDGVDDLNINDNIVDEVITYDVYEQYVLNNDLFTNNNICYISKAIAYENATYDKVVNASSNNARYRELSLANIASLLSSTDIKHTTDTEVSSYLRCNVIEPTKTNTAISLFKDNNSLRRLSNTYLLPIIRHDGKYQPQTKTILSFDSDDRYERIFAKNPEVTNRYKLSISRLGTDTKRVSTYKENYVRDIKYNDFYEYSVASLRSDVNTNKQVPWLSNPMEWRSFTSIVFNSNERLRYEIEHSSENDLSTLLHTHVKQFCPFSEFTITEELKQRMLELKYDVSQLTVANYDIEYEVVANFIRNTFIQIYEVESITTNNNIFVNFIVDGSILTILDDIPMGTKLQLNFKR